MENVGHSRGKGLMDSKLSFFKFILDSQQMVIPRSFVAEIQKTLPELQEFLPNSMVLKDKYMNTWQFQVSRIAYKWRKFYVENSLERGDIMVFEHECDNIFYFRILGANACEKEGVGHFIKSGAPMMDVIVKEEQVSAPMDTITKEEEEEEEGDDDPRGDEGSSVDDDDGDNNDGDYQDENIGNEDDNDNIDDDGITFERMHRQSTMVSSPNKSCKRPDWYGTDIFKSRRARRPQNPYFVTKSRIKRHQNNLYIPIEVIMDNKLIIPDKILLADEKGRTWESEVKKWTDGRMWCTKGWKSLCRVNGITPEDTCICEFVQKDKDTYIVVKSVDVA